MTGLEASCLSFSFGDLIAVDGVSLQVRPGEILALIGPNGAGKTTTIDLLAGDRVPDSGTICWQDRALTPAQLRRTVGLCPQQLQLWPRLRCEEQLVMIGRLHGLTRAAARSRAQDLLERLGLTPKSRTLADQVSGGMQRRLAIALALMNDPPAVVLDEPEAGLDPQSRVLVRDLIAELGRTRAVLITSHDIAEVERLADQVVIIDAGHVVADGTPEALRTAHDASADAGLEDIFLALTGRGLRE